MFTSTTKYQYRQLAIKRGKRIARINCIFSIIPDINSILLGMVIGSIIYTAYSAF